MRARMAAATMLLGLLMVVPAQAGDWEVLGERTVTFKADRDVISVTASEGLFTKVKLQVRHRGIELRTVKITYGDGTTHTLRANATIPAGGETREFDLPGPARVIRRVEFDYRSRLRGRGAQRALVRLLGKSVGPSADEPKPPADPPAIGDWELLGERKVNFKVDRDVIRVSGSEGTFTKIKLKVLQNRIELLDLKIHFGNGGTQDVKVRRIIQPGGETRVIDLNGGARVISKVELLYRSGLNRDDKAVVRLWGRS